MKVLFLDRISQFIEKMKSHLGHLAGLPPYPGAIPSPDLPPKNGIRVQSDDKGKKGGKCECDMSVACRKRILSLCRW